MTNKNYDINNQYNEAEALQQLLRAVHHGLDVANERFESDESSGSMFEQFHITVAGVQTAFVLGGPQVDALLAFIEHIAHENFYSVDFDKLTVIG